MARIDDTIRTLRDGGQLTSAQRHKAADLLRRAESALMNAQDVAHDALKATWLTPVNHNKWMDTLTEIEELLK